MEHMEGFLHSPSTSYRHVEEVRMKIIMTATLQVPSCYMSSMFLVSRSVFLSVIPGLLEYSATYQDS